MLRYEKILVLGVIDRGSGRLDPRSRPKVIAVLKFFFSRISNFYYKKLFSASRLLFYGLYLRDYMITSVSLQLQTEFSPQALWLYWSFFFKNTKHGIIPSYVWTYFNRNNQTFTKLGYILKEYFIKPWFCDRIWIIYSNLKIDLYSHVPSNVTPLCPRISADIAWHPVTMPKISLEFQK